MPRRNIDDINMDEAELGVRSTHHVHEDDQDRHDEGLIHSRTAATSYKEKLLNRSAMVRICCCMPMPTAIRLLVWIGATHTALLVLLVILVLLNMDSLWSSFLST